jgi:hypothetical protein
VGLCTTVRSLVRKGKRKAPFSPEERVMVVALLSLGLYTIFFTIVRHPHHPHYYNAVAFSFFYVIWWGWDVAWRAPLRGMKALFALQAGSGGMLLAVLILFLHVNGGNCGIRYGATLGNQVDVVRTVLHYSPQSRISSFVPNYSYFPHAFTVLVELLRPQNPGSELPTADIVLFQKPTSGSGRIYLNITERSPGEAQRP